MRITRRSVLRHWTVALLVAAALLATFLTYEAYTAARTHRGVAEQALRDYAAVGAWTLELLVHGDLKDMAYRAALPGMTLLARDSSRFDLDAYAARLAEVDAPCKCLDDVPLAYTWSPADGWRFAGDTAARATLGAWVRESVPPQARSSVPAAFEPPRVLNGDPTRTVQHPVRWAAYAYAVRFGTVGDTTTMTMFVVERDARGEPVRLFGFARGATEVLWTLTARALASGMLLPPAIVRSVDESKLLEARVLDPEDRPLLITATAAGSPFAARDTLPEALGGLTMELGLEPRLAERLVIGGLPRSRLPELLVTLALLVGTVVVVAVQLRREGELSELRAGFVAGVSHELRTPLAQIRVLAEFLQMERPVSPERMRRSLRIIDQEARRLSFLVDNVLAYGRAERQDVRIARERLVLAREVTELLELFAPLARAQEVTVRTAVPEDLVAHADPSALRQVLINLLDNAVRYGPAGQTVTVSAAADERGVTLTVDDEGPGVPRESRERVFEPYARLARDSRSARGGSGIGLSVVRELVEAHGGTASIGESPAGGARVTIRLPHGVRVVTPDSRRTPDTRDTRDTGALVP